MMYAIIGSGFGFWFSFCFWIWIRFCFVFLFFVFCFFLFQFQPHSPRCSKYWGRNCKYSMLISRKRTFAHHAIWVWLVHIQAWMPKQLATHRMWRIHWRATAVATTRFLLLRLQMIE
jgi:hypothetical protein